MTTLQLPWRGRARQARSLATLRPVVLMGRGHSGTRVLSWLCAHLGVRLGSSPAHVTGDPDDLTFTGEIKTLARHNLGVTSTDAVRPGDLRRFRSAVAAFYARLGRPTGPWGWKFPETYLIPPYVALTFPGARILHLVRDGRDVAFKTHLTDDPRHRLGRAVLAACDATGQPHHVQAAASWAWQVDRFDAFRAERPLEHVLDVRFRDLCTAPAEWAERIAEFLELPMTPACRDYVAHGIDARKVGQYRSEDPALVREAEQRAAPTLARYRFIA